MDQPSGGDLGAAGRQGGGRDDQMNRSAVTAPLQNQIDGYLTGGCASAPFSSATNNSGQTVAAAIVIGNPNTSSQRNACSATLISLCGWRAEKGNGATESMMWSASRPRQLQPGP